MKHYFIILNKFKFNFGFDETGHSFQLLKKKAIS